MTTPKVRNDWYDEMLVHCLVCGHIKLYHRAEDNACPTDPIFDLDGLTKRRVFAETYFTLDVQ